MLHLVCGDTHTGEAHEDLQRNAAHTAQRSAAQRSPCMYKHAPAKHTKTVATALSMLDRTMPAIEMPTSADPTPDCAGGAGGRTDGKEGSGGR